MTAGEFFGNLLKTGTPLCARGWPPKMEAPMAHPKKPFNPDQPEMPEEMPEQARRRDPPVPDAPATVPRPDEDVQSGAPRPPEDGGVDQHPIHDSDVDDLGPEDYEEMTDEVAKRGIRRER
jgi:hypothetical protein